MKVIKNGYASQFPYQVTCWSCRSELEVDFKDITVNKVERSDMRGEKYTETVFNVLCPVCHTKLALTDANFSSVYTLEHKIRKHMN